MHPAPRRWLMVAALFVVTYGASTPLSAYGVFLPVLAETFPWSRGAISTALSINLLLGGVAGLGVGALSDRYGPRVMLVTTVALAGASFALISKVEALWQLYLLVGVLGGIGMSAFYLLSAATVMRWFDDHRGLALALVLVGFNLSYISGGPLAAWLIARLGWRAAYALLGGGCGLISVLAALTVRLPRGPEVPLAAEPAPADGARLAAVPGLTFGAVTGRIGAGAVSGRVGGFTTLSVGYVLQILALIALLWVPSWAALLGSLAVFGVGFGASDTMLTKVFPDVFGVRALGAIMGVLVLGWRFGAALGPATAGFLYDLTGSYAMPFAASPVVVLASWGLFMLGWRGRRA